MNHGDTSEEGPEREAGETSIIDDVERIRVRVESPGRNVVATWTARRGLRVTFAEGATRSCSEGSLGDELTAAVRGVARGYAQAATKLLGPPDPDGVPVDGELAQRYQRDVDAVEVRCKSPRGHARADIADGEAVRVRLRPGVLASKTPPEALASDVDAVIEQAVGRYHGEIGDINRRYRELTTTQERKPV